MILPRALRWLSSPSEASAAGIDASAGTSSDIAGGPSRPCQTQQAQACVVASEAEVQRWQDVRSAYRTHLSNLSRLLHPWCLVDATRHTSQEVERKLHAEVAALAMVLETQGLPVKKTVLEKVRRQLAGVSALVDLWWQRVRYDLEPMALTPRWTQWVDELLLPLMYWQDHLSRTRCLPQKAQIAQALKTIEEAFERHPYTQRLAPEVLADWKAWAADHARAFQRASGPFSFRIQYR